MAVPKKRTSLSKKRIRKNLWKRKGYWAARKALSLAKSLSTGNAKFCTTKEKKEPSLGFGNSKKKKEPSLGFGNSKKKKNQVFWIWKFEESE
uniref:ribosomal protein L32 n=1 Tax=Corydalis pseudoimpatiens TaxID=2973998 RepID=UPI0021823EA0|nr:ribosomal protein L32 [Corydalis pseudoimpatiens]YP_010473813.1 ribosomal protein L32 [Corydalis pseudoimpatiens]UVH68017.1 ribosomal protein L32 [Corydalis pseudoimpatiens]UVH68026.1 ribosomal protein L32 [Corydalis pseudoimpatiens]